MKHLFSLMLAFIASFSQAVFGCSSPCLHADGRLATPNTYAAAYTANPKLIGELFSKILRLQAKNTDALGMMEGPEGSGKPIITKTDLSAGAADTVNFSVMARPGGRGTIGETALEAELMDLGSYSVKVDFMRKGFALNKKVEAFLAAGKDIKTAFALVCGEWFGLQRQADAFMLWRRYADSTNTYRPNSRASTDTLLSGDYFKSDDVAEVASLLKSRGAPAPIIGKRKVGDFTAEVKGYIILGSDRALNSMKTTDSSYQNALQNAGVRGDENIIWAGGYAKLDGNVIFHMDSVQEDTRGPLGLAIEPEALLGTAIASATTTVAITGGGRTAPDTTSYFPFEWFKGNPYPLIGHAAPSADSGVYYLVIYNTTGANAGKFGIYQYTGSANNGNQITAVTARLGASATGIAVTSLAGITYDSTKHTDAHPVGSRIVQVNAKCVPYLYLLGLAESAALRPYGGPPIMPISEEGDWKFKKGIGMEAIYGQGLAKDTQGVCRNYVLVEAAYRPVGLGNLPVVTS